MAAVSLSIGDLTPFATIEDGKATLMIDDALALAARVAPCILEDTFEHEAAARAILRAAILRWNDSGSGAYQSQQAGPFGMQLDTRQQRRSMFWPSEIEALQELCRDGDPTTQAFTIDSTPAAAQGDGYWSAPDVWTPIP